MALNISADRSSCIDNPKSSPFGYLQRSACPCCSTDADQSSLAYGSTPAAEDLSIGRHSDFISGYTSERVFFSYYACPTCGCRFCKTCYSEEQLAKLYGNQVENMKQVPLQARRRTQATYADLLLKHVRGEGGFLEIGPDIGLFAEHCAANHNFSSYWMLEPNMAVHNELQARLDGLPVMIREDMWPTEEIGAGSISAAALVHVLDHLLDPLAFLSVLAEKMERGAVLITVTHNSRSLLARILGKRWPPHALQHPQLYDPSSIRHLYRRAGFVVLDVQPTVNYFPLMHLVRGLAAVSGLGEVLPNLEGPVVPVRLGNIAAIAQLPVNALSPKPE